MRALWCALALTLCAACIKPADKLTCGSDVCPLTNVCIDNSYCVASDAVAACAGIAASGECLFDGQPGHCVQHSDAVCEPSVCGDNIIDDRLHEQCDGTAPIAEQCVDLGFDLGRPTCSSQCGLNVLGCTQFGWEPVINAPVISFWTDGTTIAYSRSDPGRLEITGALTLSVAGRFLTVVGGGGHIFVRSTTDLLEATASGLVSLAPPFPGDTAGIPIAGDDGSLYVEQQCDLWRWTAGTWTRLSPAQPTCASHVAVGPAATGRRVFIENNHVIYELANGTYTPIANLSLSEVVNALAVRTVAGREQLLVATSSALYSVSTSGGTATILMFGGVTTVAATSSFVYGNLGGTTRAIRSDGLHVDQLDAPAPNLIDDGKGHLYAVGGPVYRFSGLGFGVLPSPNQLSNEELGGIVDFPDGDVSLATSYQLLHPDPSGNGWQGIGTGLDPLSVHALGAARPTQRIISAYLAGGPTAVWREDTPYAFNDVTPTGEEPFIDGLWMDDAGDAFGAGSYAGKAFLGKLPDKLTTWDITSPAGCEMHGIHGLNASTVIAVGACDGVAVLWSYDGTTWSELHREPTITTTLYGVRILASGDIFAAGDSGGVWRTGGTWHVDPEIRGRSLGGTDGDVWLTGSFTPIQHWDGTQWSRMATRAISNMLVSVTRARILMPGAALDHVALLRDP